MAWDADIIDDRVKDQYDSKKNNKNKFNNKCKIDPTGGASENKYKYCDLDIPFGFQDIDPMLITVLGEAYYQAICLLMWQMLLEIGYS